MNEPANCLFLGKYTGRTIKVNIHLSLHFEMFILNGGKIPRFNFGNCWVSEMPKKSVSLTLSDLFGSVFAGREKGANYV